MTVETGRYAVTCSYCRAHWTATVPSGASRDVLAAIGASHHCKRTDSFRRGLGKKADQIVAGVCLKVQPIVHNPDGKLHRCGYQCRSARGPVCECQCGGMFHGAAHAMGGGG